AQRTATDGGKRGLEAQARAALLRLTQREAQLSAARLVQAAGAGQAAAQYLIAMAQRGTGAWSVARRLRRKPTGQYWDPNPARRSDIFIPRSVPIDAAVLRDVRDSAALDAVVPELLAQVPNATAMYYISPHAVE